MRGSTSFLEHLSAALTHCTISSVSKAMQRTRQLLVSSVVSQHTADCQHTVFVCHAQQRHNDRQGAVPRSSQAMRTVFSTADRWALQHAQQLLMTSDMHCAAVRPIRP